MQCRIVLLVTMLVVVVSTSKAVAGTTQQSNIVYVPFVRNGIKTTAEVQHTSLYLQYDSTCVRGEILNTSEAERPIYDIRVSLRTISDTMVFSGTNRTILPKLMPGMTMPIGVCAKGVRPKDVTSYEVSSTWNDSTTIDIYDFKYTKLQSFDREDGFRIYDAFFQNMAPVVIKEAYIAITGYNDVGQVVYASGGIYHPKPQIQPNETIFYRFLIELSDLPITFAFAAQGIPATP